MFTSYVGYVSKLGALGLTGPDEPRYTSIARNMAGIRRLGHAAPRQQAVV